MLYRVLCGVNHQNRLNNWLDSICWQWFGILSLHNKLSIQQYVSYKIIFFLLSHNLWLWDIVPCTLRLVTNSLFNQCIITYIILRHPTRYMYIGTALAQRWHDAETARQTLSLQCASAMPMLHAVLARLLIHLHRLLKLIVFYNMMPLSFLHNI